MRESTPITVAILSDLHDAEATPIPARMGHWGAVLLKRAVERLRRHIKPDLVLLLGDCIDQPDASDAMDRLARLRIIMDRLECPWLAIPGNHDPAPDRFYEAFPRPPEVWDVAGVRVLPFLDPEQPGYHARRTDEDLARMRSARRDGFAGPVIAAQHVSLYPAFLQRRLAYHYTNLDDVLAAGRAGGVDLCVGGHSHTNTGVVRQGRSAYLSVDALCEPPFSYTLVTITPDAAARSPRIDSHSESLAMPAEYELVDYHSHTQFAYCGEDVHTTRSPAFAELMGLKAMAFTEHSGQLYFPKERYWGGDFARPGAVADPADDRMDAYFDAVAPWRSTRVLVGLEVDADHQGDLVLQPRDAERTQLRVGAVHVLPVRPKSPADEPAFVEAFQHVTSRLVEGDIHILAHPFRIFRRHKLTPPATLFPWLAKLLRKTGVAAEINFHTNEPPPDFFRVCLEQGVPLTFGGDAHELWEIGEFHPHLALLARIGVTGDLTSILWRSPALADA